LPFISITCFKPLPSVVVLEYSIIFELTFKVKIFYLISRIHCFIIGSVDLHAKLYTAWQIQ